jgi:hypothetical protein
MLALVAQAGLAGAATADTWKAVLDGHGITGKAAVVVPVKGEVTARYTLWDLHKGDVVKAKIVAGEACNADATLIKRLPGYTTTMGGDWRQVWRFAGDGARALRAAIDAEKTLWFVVKVDDARTCGKLVLPD